ncbi:alpha/beta hydrolase [Xanthomonas melonis]|uniref:Alpha/beta hydrolase n=1 Tax=Xanthomonas melonis TaxID=56456 RepID=A0ABS8NU44_9XANT|nr:alpha/beta hydrolase [Xanthomonas melonis]MCD0258206.1 alpha/beta hydrolase [Xanthomonas melonis]MCD0266442.1 alpha/beta hydrolase [Xanthomonas melonis]
MEPFDCTLAIGRVTGLRSAERGRRRVLALHGWLDNAASFLPLSAHLQAPDLDLVLLDLPGHGHSAWLPVGAEYTLSSAIHNLLQVADALGWDRFTLLGHSLGGGVASLMAAAAPERIEALVVIEALGALAEPAENTAERLRDSVRSTRGLPQRPLRVFGTMEAPIRARMMANQLTEPAARLLVERGLRAVDGGYSWCTDPRLTLPTAVRMTEAQIDALLTSIVCPTQAIFATPAQPYFSDTLRDHRVALVPDARLALLPGTHHVHMETPQPVAAVIDAFLASLPVPSPRA